MKLYFLDTEFIEDGGTIELISSAIESDCAGNASHRLRSNKHRREAMIEQVLKAGAQPNADRRSCGHCHRDREGLGRARSRWLWAVAIA